MSEFEYLTIGRLVQKLQPTYPDLTVSKVRYLEDEGLLHPLRSTGGYRKYSPKDVARLESILYMQKHRFYPLAVIKEQLERQEREGSKKAVDAVTESVEEVPFVDSPEMVGKLHPIDRMPEICGTPVSFVRSLADAGLIQFKKSPQGRDLVEGRDLALIRACDELRTFGIGPKNLRQYVMAAKQLVSLTDVAIDMPAGPSEVEVLADSSANAAFVAADLLSQAEHGADSQVVLVSTDEDLLRQVQQELAQQLAELPRRELAEKALSHSVLILVRNMDEAVALTNRYAPEHLVVATANYRKVAERITHAGSVFLGPYSCESAGDYASGTNHTLPTKGYARAYSGLCLDSFMRKMTLQELSAEGVAGIGPAVVAMARAERLDAHSKAMEIRLNHINR